MNFTKIYVDSDEKFVASIVLYAKKSDDFIYSDAGCTVKIDKDTLMNLCEKRLPVVSYAGAFYPIAAYKVNSTKKCFDITIYDVLASTVAAVTIHSAEYTA